MKYSSVTLICCLLVALVQAVPEGRILGGSSALPGQFPYLVSLKLHGKHTCGGSIISRNYILTAAHCVVNKNNIKFPITAMTVQAGTNYRKNGGFILPIAETIAHSRYISEGNLADIALVRLAKPLAFCKTIKPIELSSKDVPENTPVVISGWGLKRNEGALADKLKWTVLHSLSGSSCYSATRYSPDKILCLGHATGKGICSGDSGGPAVVNNQLVGVASFFSIKCGTHGPDGYIKVSAYLDWIKEHSDVPMILSF